MNGILCIDKPAGFTSFDVIAKMRGILRIRKIGHTGTLDPMATGVLPLLIGRATKAADVLPNENKRYIAGFQLGKMSDTQDVTGTVEEVPFTPVTEELVRKKLQAFEGEIEQIPPMYSAVQVGGKRLYDLARAGREVERKPRNVVVYRAALLSFDEISQSGTLDISCSKGTYIRTICHDLGQALGTGGVLSSLRRTEASGFALNQCLTLEQVEQYKREESISSRLLSIETLFLEYPEIWLSEAQTRMFGNGVKLDLARVRRTEEAPIYRVKSRDSGFLGLARPDFDNEELRIVKMFG